MRLQPIGLQAWYPKSLTKRINEHNAKVDAIDQLENSLPVRRQELAARVLAGQISGTDAIAARAEINRLAATCDIDRNVLLHERDGFWEDTKASDNAEADKMAALALKRRKEIETTVSSVLRPAEVANAVSRDGVFRQYDEAARSCRQKAMAGPRAFEDNTWATDFEIKVAREFRFK